MALCNNSIGYVTYMHIHVHVETQLNAFPLYTYNNIYIYVQCYVTGWYYELLVMCSGRSQEVS